MRTETLMLRMSNLLSRIAAPASFSFHSEPREEFNKMITRWLNSPESQLLPNGSIVGLCCLNLLALQFREEEESESGQDLEELTNDFQRLLLAASMSHTGSYYPNEGEMRREEIHAYTTGHMSGSRLLLRLDRTLTPHYLSKLSRSSCQVLFLFVLGAVLGMGYSSSPDLQQRSPPDFPAEMLMGTGYGGAATPDFQQSPTLWLTMREHLCQMLAHHLIYVGGMLGIKLEAGMERRIIESAGRGWGKTLPEEAGGEYVWGDGIVEKRKGNRTGTSPIMAEQPPPPHALAPLGVFYDWNSPKSQMKYSSTPPSSPPLGYHQHSPLVPVACDPELAHLQSQHQNTAMQDWDQNPASYLDMEFEEEPENYRNNSPPPYDDSRAKRTYMEGKIMASYPRSNTEPYYNYTHEQRRQEYGAPREFKRRTMWIVRTVDAGPPYGEINVHARLRGGRDLEGLRSFV